MLNEKFAHCRLFYGILAIHISPGYIHVHIFLTCNSGVPYESLSQRVHWRSRRRRLSSSTSPFSTTENIGESSGSILPMEMVGFKEVNPLSILMCWR